MLKLNIWRARFVLPALIMLTGFVKAQTGAEIPQMAGVDATVKQFMMDWNIPGGTVAFAKNGKLIYSRGFGYSDLEMKKPTKPGDRFRIASISKPITSIAVMKLVEEGRLSLDSKVFGANGVLNDAYYNGVIKDERAYDITVQHLLEHTAGWDRNEPYGRYEHSDAPFFPLHVTAMEEEANPVGDSTLIRFSLATGLHFAPGTKFSYSNVGYLVLGKVIAKVSGMRYEEFVKLAVLDPAGAGDTRLGRNLRKDKLPREVDYFSQNKEISCYGDGAMVPEPYGGFNLEAMNAHGGWVSTAPDLVRILQALDGIDSCYDVLSPAMVRLMTTPGEARRSYARGWSVNSRNTMWHTGSLAGSAVFAGKTSDGLTWVFLFNSRSSNNRAFWKAFDDLPWDCLKTVEEFPAIDLFDPGANVRGVTAHTFSTGTKNVNEEACLIRRTTIGYKQKKYNAV